MITLAFMANKFTSVSRCVVLSIKMTISRDAVKGRGMMVGAERVVIKNTVYISTQDVAFNADVSKKHYTEDTAFTKV